MSGNQRNIIAFYDEFYTKAENSKAHAVFCERVYGRNLCQHGMADMAQIEQMLRLMALNENSRVLDLGCGNGRITEYIQGVTRSSVTGIDISPGAVESATLRTKEKSDKLMFQAGDMMNLKLSAGNSERSNAGASVGDGVGDFDAILLIDTHYFVDDFEALLDILLELTAVGGRVCIFSDEGRGIPGCNDSDLQAEESLIGQILRRRLLPYTAINLNKENTAHWKLKERVLREMRGDFEAEGNLFLYHNRLGECTVSDRDLDCRFLFCITKR